MKLLPLFLILFLTAPASWGQLLEEEQDLPPIRKKHRVARRMDHNGGAIVKIGAPCTVRTNETAGSVVVIGDDARIEGDVEQVVVISGSAYITGSVRQEVVVILGKVELGPKASIGREVVSIGGTLKVHPEALVGEKPFELSLPGLSSRIEAFNKWFATGLLLGRPLPLVSWAWITAGVFLAFYILVAALFPRPIAACVGSLDERPASSLLAGILAIVLFGPVCFLLAISVIGIPAIPIVLCGLFICAVFGKVALLQYVGKRVTALAEPSWATPALLALLLGAAVLAGFYMVPFVGFLMVALSGLLGLGAAVLALGRNFSREARPAGTAAALAAPIAVTPEGTVPPTMSAEGSMVPAVAQAIYMERAGFWLRFWASMLDLLLIGGLGLLIGPFMIPVLVAYHVGLWTWRGTTVGGIVLGLKVVRTDGKPIDFAVALVRSLASFFSAAVLFLGFFWAGWNKEKQSWHDKIAGTVVVKVPKGISLI